MVEEMRCEVDRPLESLLPDASQVCLDFLHQLLAFDPTKRISASAALYHPYIVSLSDSVWETVAPTTFSWDFDSFEPTRSALKDRVYLEVARLHPDILARDAAQLVATGRGHLLAGDDILEAPPQATSVTGGADFREASPRAVMVSGSVGSSKPMGPPPAREPGSRLLRSGTGK